MSNQGRALISALNSGDYQSVDQYNDLSDQDIKIVNHHVHELFERAIRTENFKLFLALLKIPHVKTSSRHYCALRHATKQGLVEYVSELGRVPGLKPNLRDKTGNTALLYAVTGRWNQAKALKLVRAILVAPDLNVNVSGSDKRTAFHHAMEKEWFEVGQALFDAGAHPRIEDQNEQTPLGIATTKGGEIPDTLFMAMLNFAGPPPAEVADEADPDDDAPAGSIEEMSTGGKPYDRTVRIQPPTPQVQQQQQVPQVKQVMTTTVDTVSSPDPKVPDARPAAEVTTDADNVDFDTIMDGQGAPDELTKDFLFTPAPGDPRYRLHRKAVLEQLEELDQRLKANGQPISREDCSRQDPATGLTLWHVAARHGHFLGLLRMMADRNAWPSDRDLSVRDDEGRSITDYLVFSETLHTALNSPVWQKHPRLLAAVLASLSEENRARFGKMMTKVNLMILHQQ